MDGDSVPLSGCSLATGFAGGFWVCDEEEDEDVGEDGDAGCDRHSERGAVGGGADEAGTGEPGGGECGLCSL
jgi:hypothetical protein